MHILKRNSSAVIYFLIFYSLYCMKMFIICSTFCASPMLLTPFSCKVSVPSNDR